MLPLNRVHATAARDSKDQGRRRSHRQFANGRGVTDSTSAFTYGAFGTALLHAATAIDGPDSNRILSPFGGGQALALALMAARDSTERAIAGTLAAGPLTSRDLAARNRTMDERLQTRSDLVFKATNALRMDTAESTTEALS